MFQSVGNLAHVQSPGTFLCRKLDPVAASRVAVRAEQIYSVQKRFLRELRFNEVAVLNDYRLAPLESRRGMAMLGALHQVTLGVAPAQLMALFLVKPAMPAGTSADRQRLRHWRVPQDCHLHTEAHFHSSNVLHGVARCRLLSGQASTERSPLRRRRGPEFKAFPFLHISKVCEFDIAV